MSNEDPSTNAPSTDAFVGRHIGPDHHEVTTMLSAIGVETLDELINQTVPGSILVGEPLDLEPAKTEREAIAALRDIADQNELVTSLIGTGYYDTVTPAVITRNVLENPAWYTAYTPYQPEISQGRLEALLNFQTMVSDLAGVDMANASMLDEGTAAAEAMTLLQRASKNDRNTFVVDQDCHPQTIAVISTRAEALGITVLVADRNAALVNPDDTFGVLFQYPGTTGEVYDLEPLAAAAHDAGALVAAAADVLALVVLRSPGDAGADVVVGTTQRFGVPLGYGGPHAGYLATTEKFKRSLPGRIVGMSIDTKNRPALRLALQTREQHIRREKATSNICTAQVLLANISGFYASYHGPDGLREIARRVHRVAASFASAVTAAGFAVSHESFFDTVSIEVPGAAHDTVASALAQHINIRLLDGDRVSVSFDETSDLALVERLLAAFPGSSLNHGDASDTNATHIPEALLRTDDILDHAVFRKYRSETEMLRYLRYLADKDIALDRSMIPLGSCTMKLNATTEMEPITWPAFANMHPFAPTDQAAGYRELTSQLEAMLVEITGYDAVSLQPNAGSQGELAGLLAIRGFHLANGDTGRTICLIPASAHGTNAASAVMAGMKVVVVACDNDGNVDVEDLTTKADQAADALAAIMVTYPSTHGVFETAIREICDIVHGHGGQVYLDGANLNAMVGTAKPGKFGADVSHLNLHKTFCIPHGGGGPGVGPIGVGAHLAPHLPNHPFTDQAGPGTGAGAISAAPWGSAGILPISWAYIAMMGPDGLRRATEIAILNANYVAARLDPHYPVLYRGENERVAHECILDLRPLKDSAGISVDDVAKRLIDYGFHAPTMSFPVAGTLMIEPTESESLEELDRFCDAMIAIRAEIAAVERGDLPGDDNPLVHAPHTAEDLLVADWDHPYTRETAAYPVDGLRRQKVWAPVSRIDSAHGDKNLVCSCPPMSDYE